MCGCIFQEDGIVVRSSEEKWYILIRVEMDIKDINDFNLRTKELGCNYWGTYTKSRIGGVQVTSLHRDPIGVDNRSLSQTSFSHISTNSSMILTVSTATESP